MTPKVDLPSSTERERAPEALRKPHIYTLRGALQRGPALARTVATAGGRTRARDGDDDFFSCHSKIEAGHLQTGDFAKDRLEFSL